MHRSRAVRAFVSVLLASAIAALVCAPAALAAPSKINGTGSTYVALAMQQWVADAQSDGLQVNYLATGSPQGLSSFNDSLVDFAGTEAEFSALGYGSSVQRGYQYVPDVAGAVAIMYNVQDKAGRKVDYLHLSRETVARIFIGDISRWSDPAITADNKGLVLPDQPINVIYRGGQSGTTALFYDFVQHTIPDKFNSWAAKNQLPTDVRIVQLDGTQFAPKIQALNGSDQIAQQVASNGGRWSIAYDEFGYAVTYDAETAWVENQAGQYQLPYAENISAALESARLKPDLSQDLSGVYASTNPDAYPISAYSYVVTQCAPTADRATCKGPYVNGGVAETLTKWMRYIACDGQVQMAEIGYSPLPPNLSQEMANSIGRMNGEAPETLSAGNCANPRFKGNLGTGAAAPDDPLQTVGDNGLANGAAPPSSGGSNAGINGGSTGSGSSSGNGSSSGSGSSSGNGSSSGSGNGSSGAGGGSSGAVGEAGSVEAVGGGSSQTRVAAPVAYDRAVPEGSSAVPVALLLIIVLAPLIFMAGSRSAARKASPGGHPRGGPLPPPPPPRNLG